MIIGEILVSSELVETDFVCNLSACKGACCWEGDWGAPLDKEEMDTLERIYPNIKRFLAPAGVESIEQQGLYQYYEKPKAFGTPLLPNGACVYLTFDPNGVAKCGIEKAWEAGATDFRKPISCHLYPVRVNKEEGSGFEALNYDKWDICSAACSLGKSLKVPVFRFVKEALIRKYGEAFYEELEAAALQYYGRENF